MRFPSLLLPTPNWRQYNSDTYLNCQRKLGRRVLLRHAAELRPMHDIITSARTVVLEHVEFSAERL